MSFFISGSNFAIEASIRKSQLLPADALMEGLAGGQGQPIITHGWGHDPKLPYNIMPSNTAPRTHLSMGSYGPVGHLVPHAAGPS